MNPCEEIYPGIFKVVQHRTHRIAPPVNVYIIAGQEGLVFDAGYGDDTSIRVMGEALAYIHSLNKKWKILYVLPSHTHPDHFSGLKRLREHYGLKVMLTEQMASVISSTDAYRHSYRWTQEQQYHYSTICQRMSELPLQLVFRSMYKKVYGIAFLNSHDKTVSPGQTLSINGHNVTILQGPGHCNDHIMLYDEKKGILFAGDNILRSIYTWLGPPRSDLAQYYSTLEMCLHLPNLQLILSAHGKAIQNPKERIKEIIEYRKLRTRQVFSIIANEKNGMTFNTLLDILYPTSLQLRWLAKGWIIITVEYLVRNRFLAFEGKKIKALCTDVNKL